MIALKKDSTIYTSSKINNIIHGFGTKQLGDGRDANTLIRYLSQNHIQYQSLVIPHQTHSSNVQVITRQEEIVNVPNCDGLVIQLEGVVLSAITADCVPIIFADKKNRVIGISHQGWKGTLDKLPQKMINEMVKIGAKKKDIVCAIGPSINSCCYQIYGERYEPFNKEFGAEVFQINNKKDYLNLIKANYLTLTNHGILPENIDYHPFCTSCNSESFWSYRRDKGIKGEMVSFVVQ